MTWLYDITIYAFGKLIHYTLKLLGMEDVIVESYEEGDATHHLWIALTRKTQTCPICGTETAANHDYWHRRIVDLSIRNKRTIIHYRRRRYQCL